MKHYRDNDLLVVTRQFDVSEEATTQRGFDAYVLISKVNYLTESGSSEVTVDLPGQVVGMEYAAYLEFHNPS